MKTITYSKDVDALLIELSNEAIAYAEDEGNVILHYSQDDKLTGQWEVHGNPTSLLGFSPQHPSTLFKTHNR